MGCQESQIIKLTQSDIDLPSKQPKHPKKKKHQLERLHGRCPTQKIYQNIKKIDRPKTPQDLEFIEKAISKHFLLFKLSKHERKELADAMNAYQTEAGHYVFQQGTLASMFFIIQEGEVQIQINKTSVKQLRKGQFFGELALLYSAPRSASVKATEKTTFWCLSQHLFQKIQKQMVNSNYRLAKPFVRKLPIFSFLSNKQKDAISYNMNTLKYQVGDAIFKEGDDATSFYIIISGLVQIKIPNKDPIKLKNGDSFGQNCLKPNQIRSGTALCLQKTQLLAMSRQDLKSCLGDKSLQELSFQNIVKWSLRRSQIFKGCSSFDESKLVSLGQFVYKQDEENICQVGEQQDQLYICLEGSINQHGVGAIFHEAEAMEDSMQVFAAKNRLTKKGAGYIFSIPLKYVQKQRNKEKKKNLDIPKRLGSKRQIVLTPRSSITGLRVDLKDLYVVCKLGEGQMGKVYLVQNKKTQKLYALKCVEKNIALKHEMQKFVKAQKQILQLIDCPFIIKLYETYKDSHFIYFLLRYIEGGDLFDFLSQIGICSTTTAQFYFGCLMLAIEYLHKKSIVYRDLKPQNAVVDANGYLHMIDLGTAKQLIQDSDSGFRTFTIIGTPHYMAPQVMEAKGYSFSVDVWSLGIILYEMLCGVLPYGGYSDDPVRIYKQIEKNDLRFPKNFNDSAGKALIFRLLQKHSEKRAVHNFQEIKNMEFFKNFSWSLLEQKKLNAPIKPKFSDNQLNNKRQYLLSYLQKQKIKMEKPIIAKHSNWDQIF